MNNKCVKQLFYVFMVAIIFSCKPSYLSPDESLEISSQAKYFHKNIDELTDVIVHDIFSPPVASRVYVYPCIAAYEVMAQSSNDYLSFAGQLDGLNDCPTPENAEDILYPVASMEAFFLVAKALVFSEDKIVKAQDDYFNELDSLGVSPVLLAKSKAFGKTVSEHILAWANKDNYKESRSFPKYTIKDEPGRWKPTPPAYMESIEPHWREIRTMVLVNANQFSPAAPPQYDMTKGSDFYNKTKEVYDAVVNVSVEEKEIASFWDCNPYVMNQTGHLMFATKKITPGGHWMGIANIASKLEEQSFLESTETASMTAIALFDGFISCWDEKYNSNLIRPETVINEHIDESWKPVLQTPPFPEHTSGHSVISSAAATVLTALIGDNFAYTDDVEVKYGLPARKFTSFLQASEEAAISRLYGGIHYMPAITDGVKQGRNVGDFIVQNIHTKKH